MGLCVFFHRTWTPGYGEYIDPNRLSQFHRRLNLAKKVCAAIFAAVVLAAIVLLLYLLYSRSNKPCTDNQGLFVSALGSGQEESSGKPSKTATSTTQDTPIRTGNISGTQGLLISALGRSKEKTGKLSASTATSTTEDEENNTSTTTASTTTAPTTTASTTTAPTTTASTTTVPTTTAPTTTVPTTTVPTTTASTTTASTTTASTTTVPTTTASTTTASTTTVPTTTASTTTESIVDFVYFNPEDEDDSTSIRTGNKRDSPTSEDMPSTIPTSTTLNYEDCSEPNFQCALTQGCIPATQRCDGRFNCNGYPYTNSASKNLEMFADKGFHGDRSDELNCPCLENHFVCDDRNQSECIHNSLVCDSVKDCRNGRDEEACVHLSNSLDTVSNQTWNSTEGYGLQGYVLVRVKGSWHPYCTNDWSREMGRQICAWFDHKRVLDLLILRVADLNGHRNVPLQPVLGKGSIQDETANKSGYKFLLIGGNKPFTPMTSGPVEEIATETYAQDGINCTIAYLTCAKI